MSLKRQQKFATILLFALSILSLIGFARLSVNANYQAYFAPNSAELKRFKEMQQKFQLADSLLVVLDSSELPLKEVEHFTKNGKELESKLTELSSVVSLQSFIATIDQDSMFFNPMEVIRHPLLSEDGKTGLIALQVRLENPENPQVILSINEEVRNIAKSVFSSSDVEVLLAGTLALNEAYISTVRKDLRIFFPLLLFSFFLIITYLFRSLLIAMTLLLSGILAIVLAAGISGWMGIPLAAINAFSPVIILGLSLVTVMHSVVGFYQNISHGQDVKLALEKSYLVNFKPLTLSSLSTALGFLLLLFSPSPPIKLTGFICAAGVIFSYLICLGLLSRLLPKLSFGEDHALCVSRLFSFQRNFSIEKPEFLGTFLFLIALIGIFQLKIDDNVYRYFSESNEFRQAIVKIDKEMDGIVRLNVLVQSQGQSLLDEIQYIELQRVYQYLDDLDIVEGVIPEIKGMSSDRVKLRLSSINRNTNELKNYLSDDNRELRIELLLKEKSSSELWHINREIGKWLKQNTSSLNVNMSGSADLLFSQLSLKNAESMFFALLVALILISFMMVFYLNSIHLAVLAFTINFYPLAVAYGFWSWFDGNITLGSAVVMGMIMGIVVDDTIHLLLKYKIWQQQSDSETALHKVIQQVLPIVVITSVTLMISLAVGLFSSFRPIFEISLLSILVIAIALFSDAILLPRFLRRWNG